MGNPKRRRPRSVAGTSAGGSSKSRSKKSISKVPAPQPARRVPGIHEPADPVLRAMYRLRAADLTALEQTGLFVLGRLLHDGKREIGAALFAGLLRVSVGSANNILSALRARKLIWSNGKYAGERHGRATRWLTAKGRRLLALPSSGNERQDTHGAMSVTHSSGRECEPVRHSSSRELRHSRGREPDSGSDTGGLVRTPSGERPPGKTKTRAAAAEPSTDEPTFSIAEALCPPPAGTAHRTNDPPAGGKA